LIKLEQTIQSRAEYERIFNEAEKYRSEGRIPKAVEAYKSLLYYWCELKKKDPNVPFTINEFFIVDRLADFSVLTGNKLAAKHLLTGMSQIAKIAGNIGIRIHAVTKLLFVNLNNSLLDTAFENARSLSDIIGNIESIEISASGLIVWENNVSFYGRCKQQDEADYFVCIYDALGGLLLAFGRFSEAVMMYQRGIQIGEKNISPIVSSRLLSMKVSRATALFEKGEIELAKTSVNDVEPEADLAETITGLQIRLLDLKSKIALAQGEMGEGYRLINYIINSCRQLQLPLAEVHACFNLAQTQILLNQVNEAATILTD
jgi:tetratricopeptide (TPR) repeat protein